MKGRLPAGLRVLLLSLALVPALTSAPARAAPEVLWDWPAIITLDGARVHSEPGMEARVVARLKAGSKVRVRWLDAEWLEIVEGDYPDRFLSKQVLQVLVRDPNYTSSPEADALQLAVRVTAKDVNLRKEEPGGKSTVVVQLNKETEPLEVRRRDAHWAVVVKPERWAGDVISLQYLEMISPVLRTGAPLQSH